MTPSFGKGGWRSGSESVIRREAFWGNQGDRESTKKEPRPQKFESPLPEGFPPGEIACEGYSGRGGNGAFSVFVWSCYRGRRLDPYGKGVQL